MTEYEAKCSVIRRWLRIFRAARHQSAKEMYWPWKEEICAFCITSLNSDLVDMECERCPIGRYTGLGNCRKTPYANAAKEIHSLLGGRILSDFRYIEAELIFLANVPVKEDK